MIAAAEPLLVLAITPLLLFPTVRPSWTAIALALLVLVWIARAVVRREPFPVTPFNAALLLFCLAIPLAVWASAAPDLTIPKLTGLILGLTAFRMVAFAGEHRTGLAASIAIFVVLGLLMWALGIAGIRLAVFAPLVQRLPAALVSLPEAPDQGINPNQLAGVLVLYLPFLFASILLSLRQRRILLSLLLIVLALVGVVTLILTESRAGWIGLAAATLVLGLMLIMLHGSRRLRRTVVGLAAATFVVMVIAGAVLLPQRLGQGDIAAQSGQQVGAVVEQLSLEGRIEIWSRALYAIQDFPFTGVGLGTFRRVVNLLYPLFLVPPDTDIGHAHNILLQVAVDVGLAGLIGYIALLLVAGVAGWQIAQSQAGAPRYLALGLFTALVGLHVYGLADALALGSKPGLALWMVLGLVAALLSRCRPPLTVGSQGPQALALRNGDLGDVEQPVGDERRPDTPGPQEQR